MLRHVHGSLFPSTDQSNLWGIITYTVNITKASWTVGCCKSACDPSTVVVNTVSELLLSYTGCFFCQWNAAAHTPNTSMCSSCNEASVCQCTGLA